MLGANSYGKSAIRLVRLYRHPDGHALRDLTVAVRFEGDFEAAHVAGDNSGVLPTDTMKNTVYALAKERQEEEIESFGLALAAHFLAENPPVSRVTIEISERAWQPLGGRDRSHSHAFRLPGGERRIAEVSRTRSGASVRAGIEDLILAKTSGSAFSGFRRDRYTTLKETEDRILATSLSARWVYGEEDLSFGPLWRAVRGTMLQAFAEHQSQSVQHTLYAMAQAALERHDTLDEVRLTMPNRHHLLVDLSPFGLQNDNEVFVATEEPYGLIEATVVRSPSAPAGTERPGLSPRDARSLRSKM